jgi:hypothetical protein
MENNAIYFNKIKLYKVMQLMSLFKLILNKTWLQIQKQGFAS